MQQHPGECCRGQLCQCSINARLNLREFSENVTSITLHQNTFPSAWSTMSNACHWFLRPLSRGKHVQVSWSPLCLTIWCQMSACCAPGTEAGGAQTCQGPRLLSRGERWWMHRSPVICLTRPGCLQSDLSHWLISAQSMQAQLHCYWEHRDWGDSGRLHS